MNYKNLLNRIIKMSKNPKKLITNLIILLLCGVLLILVGNITSNLSKKKMSNNSNTVEVNSNLTNISPVNNYEETTKKELIDTLSQIDGVGKISVMIYFKGGNHTVPAMNQVDSTTKTEEKDNQGGTRITTEDSKNHSVVLVSQGGDSKPLILEENNPSIGGVAVVAEGAESSVVKERLLNAVKTVFNLPANKVTIMPMKREIMK